MRLLLIAQRGAFGLVIGAAFSWTAIAATAQEQAARLTWTVILPEDYLRLRPSEQPLLAVTVFGSLVNYRGCLVGRDGEVRYFSVSERGRKGSEGGSRELSEAQVASLSALLTRLPPGPVSSPPEGRRLVLHTFGPEGERQHGYDLADAPTEVLEVLRLSRSHIQASTAEVKPDDEWQAHTHDDGGIAMLPHVRQLITCARHQPLKLWDCDSHKLVKEVTNPAVTLGSVGQVAISPDGRLAALMCTSGLILDTSNWSQVALIKEIQVGSSSYGFNNPTFTADGKHLFMRTGAPVPRFVDTQSWTPVCNADYPDKVTRLAVLESGKGHIALAGDGKLWMRGNGGLFSGIICEKTSDFCADLSPDGKTLALAASVANRYARSDFRIQLRHAETCEVQAELRPFEQTFTDQRVYEVWWSPDGNYVFAGLEGGLVAVWNVRAGRHHATLTGAFGHVNGFALAPDASQIYLFVNSGKIHSWKMDRVLAETRAFEASLDEK
jgi:hypothetical protein